MSRGRFDRLGASSTLCHAHHSCVHIVTDTPPRDRYLSHSLGPVCLFGRTPSCGVVIRVSDLVHSVTPPPSMCSSCFIVHVWWNAQHSRSDQMPNPSQCIVLRGVHGICSRSWPGLDF